MRSPEIVYLTKDIITKYMGLCNMIDVKGKVYFSKISLYQCLAFIRMLSLFQPHVTQSAAEATSWKAFTNARDSWITGSSIAFKTAVT